MSGLSMRGKQLIALFLSDTITVAGLVSVSTVLIMASGRVQLANQAKSELAVSQIEYEANRDFPGTQDALKAVENGYSNVYIRQATGEFAIANSRSSEQDEPNHRPGTSLHLPSAFNSEGLNPDLLNKALAADGQAITHRLTLNDQTYTVAAQTIQNANHEPTALLVRGLSEQALNDLLIKSLTIQLLVATGILLADMGVAILLGHTLVNPIKRLQKTAQQFASGNRQARATVSSNDELGELANTFNQLADNITHSEQALIDEVQHYEHQAEQFKALTALTSQIQNTHTTEDILQRAVEGVRDFLQADRVVVHQFTPDHQSMQVTAESVGQDWSSSLGQTIKHPITPEKLKQYQTGQLSSFDQISTDVLAQSHHEFLKRHQVQASLVAPIIVRDKLIGLLCIHQCTYPRIWEYIEQDWLQALSIQLGYALAQIDFLQQQRTMAKREQQLYSITSNLRASANPAHILATAVHETRAAIGCDRIVVYSFDAAWQETILADTEADAEATPIDKPNPNFESQLCTKRQVEAHTNLALPILVNSQLLGILVAYQDSSWQSDEISLLNQVAHQIGYAIEQANLLQQTERSWLFAETLCDHKHQKERLQHQLIELLNQVEMAIQGDFTVRADVTSDEIGIFADCFNSLIERLRQMVISVRYSAAQVNRSVSNSSLTLQTLTSEISQQVQETELIGELVEGLQHSLQIAQANTQKVRRNAQTSSATAKFSEIVMEQAAQTILTLREIIQITTKKIKHLEGSTQQVSQMVSSLDNISMQTHLLAVNAGIEATQAGNENQNFVIAADEVSQLASQARHVTQAIETTLSSIRVETAQVTEAMGFGKDQAIEGIHLVHQTQQGMTEILGVSSQIEQSVQSINETTVSQADLSQSILGISQKIAQRSEQVSGSSDQMSDLLQKTAGLTHEFQKSVDGFKADINNPYPVVAVASRTLGPSSP